MRDDLPAPVGPVMANRSRFLRSRQVGPRKAVKPSSSSFSGRMLLLAEQVPEEGQRLRRRLVAAAQLAGVELGERLAGAQALPPLCGRRRLVRLAGALDVHGRWQDLADEVRQGGGGEGDGGG